MFSLRLCLERLGSRIGDEGIPHRHVYRGTQTRTLTHAHTHTRTQVCMRTNEHGYQLMFGGAFQCWMDPDPNHDEPTRMER
jgi:hypothetical protein